MKSIMQKKKRGGGGGTGHCINTVNNPNRKAFLVIMYLLVLNLPVIVYISSYTRTYIERGHSCSSWESTLNVLNSKAAAAVLQRHRNYIPRCTALVFFIQLQDVLVICLNRIQSSCWPLCVRQMSGAMKA